MDRRGEVRRRLEEGDEKGEWECKRSTVDGGGGGRGCHGLPLNAGCSLTSVCLRTHSHAHTHTHTRTYIHTRHTHTYMRTHTHTGVPFDFRGGLQEDVLLCRV